MRRSVGLWVAVIAVGCGGGGGGGGGSVGATSGGTALTATGTTAFTATNATSVTGGTSCQAAGATVGLAYAALIASDQGGICGYLQRNQDKAGARSIQVAIARLDPLNATTSLLAANYPVVSSPTTETLFALVSVSQSDAACRSTPVFAKAGTVSVTSIANGRIQGSLNATLTDGGTVSGTFDVEDCAVSFPGDVCAGQIGPQSPACAP